MWLKAIIAKTQGKQIRGTAKRGVGSATVGGGCEHRTFVWSDGEKLIEFAGLYQGNVRGHHQCAVDTAFDTKSRSHFNGAGLARVPGIGDNLEIVLPREFHRERIAGHESASWTSLPCGERGYNVMQHGLRQFCACRLIQHGR